MAIFFVFIVCWTPYAIITAIDVDNTFSMETHLFVTLLAHLHSSLNILIYTFSNKYVFCLAITVWRFYSSFSFPVWLFLRDHFKNCCLDTCISKQQFSLSSHLSKWETGKTENKKSQYASDLCHYKRKLCLINDMLILPHLTGRSRIYLWKTPGPGCSKLTTSLVNVLLKFQTLIHVSEIWQYFLLKKCEKLLQ